MTLKISTRILVTKVEMEAARNKFLLSPTTAGNHMAVREAFNLKNPSDCSTDSVLVSSFCRLRGLLSSLCPSSTPFGFPLVKN